MPHNLPTSTQSSRPPLPASSAPIAMLNGMATEMSPVICIGGWMNIPKWTRSGLMPCPSARANGNRSRGLARKTVTPRKKVSTRAIRPVAKGGREGDPSGHGGHREDRQDGEDQVYEEERASVAGVQGNPRVAERHRKVAVLDHVPHGEVAGDERVHHRGGGDAQQDRDGSQPVASAQDQDRDPSPAPEERRRGGISRHHQRDRKGHVARIYNQGPLPGLECGARPSTSTAGWSPSCARIRGK